MWKKRGWRGTGCWRCRCGLEAPATQSSVAEALPRPPATTQRAEQARSMNSGQARSMNSGQALSMNSRQAERPNNPATQSVAALEPHPAAPANIEVPPPPPFQITRSKTHITAVPGSITDEEIGNAIQKGVDYLIGEFGNAHRLGGAGDNGGQRRRGRARWAWAAHRRIRRVPNTYDNGEDALAVLALIQCGDAIHDVRLNINGAFMSGCVSDLRTLDIGRVSDLRPRPAGHRPGPAAPQGRPRLPQGRRQLPGRLQLPRRVLPTSRATEAGNWDNSNSQYGLLGVWAGAEVGVEVPQAYWDKVEKHWNTLPGRRWRVGLYRPRRRGRLSMTLAGVASLFVTHDYLDAVQFDGSVGRDPFTPALAKGLKWLETGDHVITARTSGLA